MKAGTYGVVTINMSISHEVMKYNGTNINDIDEWIGGDIIDASYSAINDFEIGTIYEDIRRGDESYTISNKDYIVKINKSLYIIMNDVLYRSLFNDI